MVVLMSIGAAGFSGSAAAQESTLDEMEGSGTAQDPYVITTVDELQAMNQDRDAHYVLGNDIDAGETENWNTGAGFRPIGNNPNSDEAEGGRFSGTFDGQNHTISGLTVDRPTRNDVGLFGDSTGTVKHVRITDASMAGKQSVGVAVGGNSGTVTDVTVTGTVSGTVSVGGLAGANTGQIAASGANVDVTATKRSAGGLAGSFGGDSGEIRRSYATGDVDGADYVGGVVGTTNGGVVASVFATGAVNGTENVGGLVGEHNEARLVRGYFTGTVTGTNQVGGAVGDIRQDGSIARAYTTGDVRGDDDAGAVAGYISQREAQLSEVYWNSQVSASKAFGVDDTESVTGPITGLTTDEMTGQAARENMNGLNFGPAWAATDKYPVHRWAVENVSFSIEDTRIARGDTTDATVTLELVDGRTVTASETASYGTNSSVASVEAGTVSTSETGTAEVTATIAGQTKTETLTVLEPPNITATAVSIDEDLVAQNAPVDIVTTVVNTGDIAGEDTVSLRIDGETVSEVTVSGEPDAEQNVTVDWQPESLGTYDVAVDDASAGTVEVVEPPELTTESAVANASVVSAGVSVPVSVTIANDDRLRGARNATLSVDGENVTSELVSVEPDTETTTALSWTPEEPGTYDLAVDGVSAGTVEVVPADSITVENVSTPANATGGESFDVDVTVNNTADVTLSERLRLTANGQTVGTTWAELPANDRTTVTVSGVVNNSGTTTLSAESTSSSASADLSVLEPASFALTALDAPSSVTAGEIATVSATIENQGGVAGSQSVRLSLGGTQVTSESVELAAGASTTVSGDISPSSAGETRVIAQTDDDNRTATVTVDAASTPTTPGAAGTDTSSGSGPGFGVAAVVVALLAGAALWRRR
ncbi:PGF-CTERM sorting domain-containing protein [Halomicroarcula sp. F28]|uniref:CARDB domain-containing protein n=1 Tax=Haloarcula salinisoli TaxID=2487746 RepID=UPI001C73810D|nr:CARDB domain-containing protein [Halomicroarcula salinisoli]MBX0285047.1 PGF-CTERM sorting domain-containing protein [Halomicroarcula salinisoli]